LEEGIRVAAELEDVEALVHNDAGGRVTNEQEAVRLPWHVRVRGRPRREGLRRGPLFARVGGEVEERGGDGRLPRVDPVLVVQDREERRRFARAFRGTEPKETRGGQGVVEGR